MYTTEYYPTKIRNTSLGNLCAFARIAGIISPLLMTMLEAEWVHGPYFVFCCVTTIAIIVNFNLDEDTLGRPLDTVRTGEKKEIKYDTF